MNSQLVRWAAVGSFLLGIGSACFAFNAFLPSAPKLVVSIAFDDPIERRNFEGLQKRVKALMSDSGAELQFEFFPVDVSDEAQVSSAITKIVKSNPAVIVARSWGLTRAVQQQSASIPVVFQSQAEPTDVGIVETEGWPRKNASGVTTAAPIVAAQLDLILGVTPNARRILIISDKWWEENRAHRDLLAHLSGKSNFSFNVRRVDSLAEAKRLMRDVGPAEFDVWFFPAGYAVYVAENEWIKHIRDHRIVAAFTTERWGDQAGVITYQEDTSEFGARLAEYTVAVLRGRSLSEMAVYRPSHFRLTVNSRLATELGIEIPANLLLSAERIIR